MKLRRIIGISLGLALAAAAGLAAAGEQMAKARVVAAANMPLNRAASAMRFLDGSGEPLAAKTSDSLAIDALHAAPLSSEAAIWLSDRAFAAGNSDRGEAILNAAGALGWHGELSQRVGYIRALERGDYGEAATRAEALLRRGRARGQLAADFADAAENPEYRSAIVTALTENAAWSNGLLAEQGATIPFPMLHDIFSARAAAGTPLPRQVAAPIVTGLALSGRFRQGGQLASLMEGSEPDRLIPGWPSAAAEDLPTPYDWRLFEGYTPLPNASGIGFALSRTNFAAARPAQLLLALAPGTYRLSAPGADISAVRQWRYAFACGLATKRPITRFSASITLQVAADCPTQVLSLEAGLQATNDGGLPELSLEKIG